jgi:tryptophan halogenase
MDVYGDESGPIRSILIVGGGSAGWLSAAYLNRALGDSVQITVVESKNIPRIGVGEATVSTLRFTMAFLGLADEDWMPHCNATYKTAIQYVNWNRPPTKDGARDAFYHPFFERNEELIKPPGLPYFPERGEGISIIHYWLRRHLAGNPEPFSYAAFPGARLCDAQRSPRFKERQEYEVPSAYHLDASLLGAFLSKLAVSRGVRHLVDDVVDVQLDARGFIQDVTTKDSGNLSADLFLDCSGFRSLLLGAALQEPFHSEGKSLLCDSAVAMNARNDPETTGIDPFTKATAARSGWMWEIPLFHRFGSGYVYCSRFASSDAAEAELRQHLGARGAELPANHIKMRPGRHERLWVNNCVAVGLAGGFIEPLESTTIFLIEFTLANLLTFFPDRGFGAGNRGKFNRTVIAMYEEIRDFIVLHYVLANRTDTDFWRTVHAETVIPETLRANLEYFADNFPVSEQFTNWVFRERSYACILSGLGRLPKRPYPLLHHLKDADVEQRFAAIRKRTDALVEALPDHYQYLRHMYQAAGVLDRP